MIDKKFNNQLQYWTHMLDEAMQDKADLTKLNEWGSDDINHDGSMGGKKANPGSDEYRHQQGAGDARHTYAGPETCKKFGWNRDMRIRMNKKVILNARKLFKENSATDGKGKLEFIYFKFKNGISGETSAALGRHKDADGKEIFVVHFAQNGHTYKMPKLSPVDEWCDGKKRQNNKAFFSDLKINGVKKFDDIADFAAIDDVGFCYPVKLELVKESNAIKIEVDFDPVKGATKAPMKNGGAFVDELYQYMLNSKEPAESLVQVAEKVAELQK